MPRLEFASPCVVMQQQQLECYECGICQPTPYPENNKLTIRFCLGTGARACTACCFCDNCACDHPLCLFRECDAGVGTRINQATLFYIYGHLKNVPSRLRRLACISNIYMYLYAHTYKHGSASDGVSLYSSDSSSDWGEYIALRLLYTAVLKKIVQSSPVVGDFAPCSKEASPRTSLHSSS